MASVNSRWIVGAALTLALAAGMVAGTLSGGPALAAEAGARTHHPKSTAGLHPRIVMHRGQGAYVPVTNYGAGYFTYPANANGLASASATFTMPTFSCASSTDNEWLLPGIWVYSGGALSEQVDVNFNCNSGAKVQSGIVCLNNAGCDTSLAVNPADKIIASIAYTPTATVATLKDVTTQVSAHVVGAAVTNDEVVFIGDEGPSLFGVNYVPTFTHVSFGSVQINGQYLVDGPFPAQYHLKTGSVVQITASIIVPTGAGFTTTFHHN